MTRADFLRIQAECRKSMQKLARLYPGCFDANGKPIVATLTLPRMTPTLSTTTAGG